MTIKNLTDNMSVSPQILPSDLATIKQLGFNSIICNRPDGESADQPNFDLIAKAAKEIGLMAKYVPVVPGQITNADVQMFNQALCEVQGPVLAYCRSGARSEMLWSHTRTGRAKT